MIDEFNSYQLSVSSLRGGNTTPRAWKALVAGRASPTIRLFTVHCSLFTVLKLLPVVESGMNFFNSLAHFHNNSWRAKPLQKEPATSEEQI